jgi:hypothetical protein
VAIDPLIQAITPATKWYVVLRPFMGGGDERLVRGEVVDSTGWRRVERLVELRYIQALPHGVTVPQPGGDGRRILEVADDGVVPEKKKPAKKVAAKKVAAKKASSS